MLKGSLDLKTLRHVARLARLSLTPQEEKLFLSQLSSVLDYFEILKKVNTDKVNPTYQVTDLENVFRFDQPQPSLNSKQALSTANSTRSGYLKVPKIFKK